MIPDGRRSSTGDWRHDFFPEGIEGVGGRCGSFFGDEYRWLVIGSRWETSPMGNPFLSLPCPASRSQGMSGKAEIK
jgi:hypothetical protein